MKFDYALKGVVCFLKFRAVSITMCCPEQPKVPLSNQGEAHLSAYIEAGDRSQHWGKLNPAYTMKKQLKKEAAPHIELSK